MTRLEELRAHIDAVDQLLAHMRRQGAVIHASAADYREDLELKLRIAKVQERGKPPVSNNLPPAAASGQQ